MKCAKDGVAYSYAIYMKYSSFIGMGLDTRYIQIFSFFTGAANI
jgi:hypothetical protein